MPNPELELEIQELFRYLGIGAGSGGPGVETTQVGKYRIPTQGTIVSRHHPGAATPTHAQGHFGVDLGAARGAPVYAIGPGVVTKVYDESNNKKGGNAVITSHEGGQVTSYYAHLDSVSVSVGQQVDQNTQIGTVGTSGMIYGGKKRHTAPHLHWQVKVNRQDINPLAINEKQVGQLAVANRDSRLTKTAREVRLALWDQLANRKSLPQK